MTFQRCEIWDDIVSSAGVRLAVVAHLSRCEGREDLQGGNTVEIDCPLDDQAVAHLRVRRVLRLVDSATFTEWRIGDVRGVNGENGGLVTVIATDPLLDMADAGIISETGDAGVKNFQISFNQVTVEDMIDDFILPALAVFGQAYWFKGTIEPTALLNPVFNSVTPLGALRLSCDLARDPATNRPAELRVRRNGVLGYYIDVLTEIGSDQAIADLRYRKNLRSTDHTEDGTQQATVVTPLGDPLPDGTPTGVARAAFRLDNESPANTWEITDPETGLSPVLEDAQFSGYFIQPNDNGPLLDITGTVAGSPAKISLADSTGIVAGDVYELRNDFLGTQIEELVSPSNLTLYGRKSAQVQRAGYTGVRNLVPNGFFRQWSGSSTTPPDGWEDDGGSFATYCSQNTDPLNTELSPNSVTFSQASDGGPVFGMKTGIIYPQAIEGAQYFGLKARVKWREFSGSSWFYLQIRPGGGGDLIKGITVVSPFNLIEQGESPAIGQYIDVIIPNIDLGAFNSGGIRVHVRAGAGGGVGATTPGVVTLEVTGVALYQQTGPVVKAWYEFSGANWIWAAGIRALAANAAPIERFEVDCDDLTRYDLTAFPFDELVTGGTVRITDSALSVADSVRIIGKPLVDYLTQKRTRLTLATRAQLLSEFLNSAINSSTTQLGGKDTPGTLPAPPVTAIGQVPSRWEGRAQSGSLALIQNIPAAVTEVDIRLRRYVVIGRRHNITGRVVVAGSTDAKLAVQYFRTSDSTWRYLDGVSGPYLTLAASGDILGLLATTEGDALGLKLCRWVTVGGDAAADPELGSFALIGATIATTAVPPVDIPFVASAFAYWALTEGSGDFVANKVVGGGTRNLRLGAAVGSDSSDPTWTTGPRRLVFGGGTTDKDICHYPSAPSLAAGSALFFYFEIDAFGSGDKEICGMAGGSTQDHKLTISVTSHLLTASVTEDSGGGGGTTRSVTGTTMLDVGFKGLVGFLHDGTTLGVYVNPADGLPEATTACSTALESGGRSLILDSSAFPPSANNIDNSKIGDIIFYVTAVPNQATIAKMYTAWKLIYPAMP
jgi:hypothetical protein